MIFFTTNVLGTFAVRDGRVIDRIDFPRDPEEIASRIKETFSGVCAEEKELLERLYSTGITEVCVPDPERFRGYGLRMDFSRCERFIDPMDIAYETGLQKGDVAKLILETNKALTRDSLRVPERDQVLIQAVKALDDVEEVKNRLSERLREWYSLHHPELDVLVRNPAVYASAVSGDTSSLDQGLLKETEDSKKDTLGMPFTPDDLAEVRRLAAVVVAIESFEKETEGYIDRTMNEIAPSTRELAGPLLGARLIAIAGGMERLAKLPASTIQILGAEESFFRFLKTGKMPPKHGVIFQLPEIRSAPKHLRGRISRTFAAKIALTVKSDQYRGEPIGKGVREDFLKSVERMKKQKKKPSKPQGPPMREGRDWKKKGGGFDRKKRKGKR